MIKLINADCFHYFKKIDNNSIDLILCDPPYEILKEYWDKLFDINEMWMNLKRIIKKNGVIILFAKQPLTSKFIMSNLKMFRYELIWAKPRGVNFLLANKLPVSAHENILIFYNKCKYNIQFDDGKSYKTKSGNNCKVFNCKPTKTINEGYRYPLAYRIVETEINRYHPTQKPIKLLNFLIKSYSNQNELVLDFCMGSGSTGVSCKNLNRNFIGIEKDKNFFDIAAERIKNENFIYVKNNKEKFKQLKLIV